MKKDKDKMGTDKKAALDIALSSIEKDHGKGAVMRLGELSNSLTTESISTGSLARGHRPGNWRNTPWPGHRSFRR